MPVCKMINLLLYTCFCLLMIRDRVEARCMTAYAGFGSCVPLHKCYRLSLAYNKTMESQNEKSLVEEFLLEESRHPCVDDNVCCSYDDIMQDDAIETPVEKLDFDVEALLPKKSVCGLDAITNKVIGGTYMALEEFPWIALIQYYRKDSDTYSFECGGTLINQRYVLTAAHCITNDIIDKIGTPVKVRLGEYNLTSNYDCKADDANDCVGDQTVDVEIEKIFPHPHYNRPPFTNQHDIGLIRLAKNVEFTFYVKPICLPPADSNGPTPGTNVTVAGFGKTLDSVKLSDVKQKLVLQMFDHEKCVQQYAKNLTVKLSDDQICAGGEAKKDSCTGDSGSSLAELKNGRWNLVGLVSFGLKCGEPNWPGIYTFIPHYIDWIKSIIRP